jgi:hypothetical protein
VARPKNQYRWNNKDLALRCDGVFYQFGDLIPTEKLDAKKKQKLIDAEWLVRHYDGKPDDSADDQSTDEV